MAKNRVGYLHWLKEEEELDKMQSEGGYVDRLTYLMSENDVLCMADYTSEFFMIEETVISYLIEAARCYPDIVKPLIRRVISNERAQDSSKKNQTLYVESAKVE